MKAFNRLITAQSGNLISEIDYILARKCDRGVIVNTKTFSGEECITQPRIVTMWTIKEK